MGVFLNLMRRLRRIRPATAGFFLACLALGVFASTAAATFPGANGRIAFMSTDIHTILPNGTDDQELANGSYPKWSPDGKHIAFTGVVGQQRGAVFTMRADGSNVRRVTHSQFSEGAAGYSPNGKRILFTRYTKKQATIITAHLNGSHQRILARGPGLAAIEYSPDGGHILYATGCHIWDMRPNGSHKRQLTSLTFDCGISNPDYSPDGKHIVFQRLHHAYRMRSDGSHRRQLPDCGREVSSLTYAPNGRKMVWIGLIGHGRGASGDVFTSNLGCADPVRVTHYGGPGGRGAYEPSWQPLP